MSRLLPAAGALTLLICGCASTDPLYRQGIWYPTQANDANLAAMVANPADLVSGRPFEGTDGVIAARAVQRLREDKVKPLPDSSITDLQVQAAPGSAQAAAAPALSSPAGQ